jgi:hypothetical protein
MLNEFLPFTIKINTAAIAGVCLWTLALYLSLSGLKDWITLQLERWFNFAETLYITPEELKEPRVARESQNAFYASVFSIIPFFALGLIGNWLIEISLGGSWAVSMGILACMGSGIYELGRRDGENNRNH